MDLIKCQYSFKYTWYKKSSNKIKSYTNFYGHKVNIVDINLSEGVKSKENNILMEVILFF